MLIEEARLAAELAHPNVIAVVDFGRDHDGRLLLVMEHVDGCDLAKLIATGPVPHPVAIFIVRELLAGLGYLHELRGGARVRGLVHRDVTPAQRAALPRGRGQARRLRRSPSAAWGP